MTDTGFAAAAAPGNLTPVISRTLSSPTVISGTLHNPNAKVRKWTPADEKQAAEMLLGGASYADIGGEFGITRNAVAGRVYRMNPAMKQRPPRKRKSPVEKREQAQKTEQERWGVAGYRPAPLPRPDAPPTRIDAFAEGYMGQMGRVTIHELTEAHCKFPIDQPAPELVRYCGLDRVQGSPYCADHHGRVTRKD